MATRRPLPKSSFAKVVSVVAMFSVVAACSVWFSVTFDNTWMVSLLFIAAVPIGVYFFTVRRCPECDAPLMPSKEMESGSASTAYRSLLRCDRCAIDWDTGILGDTRYDD